MDGPKDGALRTDGTEGEDFERKEQMSQELSEQYRGYAENMLAGVEQLTEKERDELPEGWQKKMQDVLDLPEDKSGFRVQETYREMYDDWEEGVMRDEILEDPELRGAGEIKVIDARHNMAAEEIYAGLTVEQRWKYGMDYVEERLAKEAEAHRAELTEFLTSYGGKLKRGRVCPPPAYSPFALMSCQKEGGEIRIDEEFVKDIKQMRKSGLEDINLVASLASKGEDGKMDVGLPEVDGYCTMIESLVRQVGEEGLTITIGNETNETMVNNPNGGDEEDRVVISQEIAPEEYGQFFREVAMQLKRSFPGLKLCLAGTSFLAPNYTERVLEAVYAEGSEEKLVDMVDFHPYRSEVDEPRVSATEGKYGDMSKREGWTYDDYENEMMEIAEWFGAELIIGEVQFGGGEGPGATVRAHRKEGEALAKSTAKGIKTNVWPRAGLPF